MQRSGFATNFIAGGIAGTTGAIATCPLDVVQTRLQSSVVDLKRTTQLNSMQGNTATLTTTTTARKQQFGRQVFFYVHQIVKTEGVTALYKGLVPNLLGIAPSRAIYFAIYSKSKHLLSETRLSHSSWTHMLSALCASISTSTATNPIWFLKTRLQLDISAGRKRALIETVRETLRTDGVGGFYRGLSASYIGSSETILYFVIYEKLKKAMSTHAHGNDLHPRHYAAGAFFAKIIATVSCYPHEVVRTRLRQGGCGGGKNVYCGFLHTFNRVRVEEGFAGLYGGMGAHVMRQVPNTVIMFLLYESIVKFLTKD